MKKHVIALLLVFVICIGGLIKATNETKCDLSDFKLTLVESKGNPEAAKGITVGFFPYSDFSEDIWEVEFEPGSETNTCKHYETNKQYKEDWNSLPYDSASQSEYLYKYYLEQYTRMEDYPIKPVNVYAASEYGMLAVNEEKIIIFNTGDKSPLLTLNRKNLQDIFPCKESEENVLYNEYISRKNYFRFSYKNDKLIYVYTDSIRNVREMNVVICDESGLLYSAKYQIDMTNGYEPQESDYYDFICCGDIFIKCD